MSAPTRELAQRRSGADDVLLLWYPATGLVELWLRDVATHAAIRLEVEPGRAIDAFYHPYIYIGRRENLDVLAPAEPASVDG